MKAVTEKDRVENYFSTEKTKFLSLLKSTKKWKELYSQTESRIALIFTTLILTVLCFAYYNTEFQKYMELLENLIQIAIESSVGMLGFIISGLAVFTGTITTKLVKNIDSDEKISALIGILFSFFFIGAVIGVAIILYIVIYILICSDLEFSIPRLVIGGSLSIYLYVYGIFYSISLLGTCLRLFFVSYKYSDENTKKQL